ncbi:MAG: AI-2E family transporter [Halanaerobium sp.]|nr:AI-2E family transporter [Halanaerobium sp.]
MRELMKIKYFRIALGVVLSLLILLLAGQIPYIMNPLLGAIYNILIPVLLGGFLYYLLRPLTRFLTSRLKYKTLAIVLSFVLVLSFLGSVIYFGGSIIYAELQQLIEYSTTNFALVRENIYQLFRPENEKLEFLNKANLESRVVNFIQDLLSKVSNYDYIGIFSSLANLGMIVIAIPFTLFYFLKDDHKLYQYLLSLFPEGKREGVRKIIREVDQVLVNYISAQIIVAFILGLIMYVGYKVISLPNALALALIALVTSFIPFLGPLLGILPALFIALTINLSTIVEVLVVLVIAQYLEGNVIRPIIQGERMKMHPLVVLFLVFLSVTLFGVLGAIFACPAFAVLRIIFREVRQKGLLET